MQTTKQKKLYAGVALIALSAVIVGAAYAFPAQSTIAIEAKPATPVQVVQPAQKSTSPTPVVSTGYKDGTYSATGQYFSPGGQESVRVDLTLTNDVVTASSVESGANDPTAESYQTSFISGYKAYVIGKKINTIKLSNVSGSSLTSQGFNDALKQIEQQAKA